MSRTQSTHFGLSRRGPVNSGGSLRCSAISAPSLCLVCSSPYVLWRWRWRGRTTVVRGEERWQLLRCNGRSSSASCSFVFLFFLVFASALFLFLFFPLTDFLHFWSFSLSLSLPVPLFLLVFMGKKWGERSTTPVQSWHRGREWSGGHWAAACRGCALCFFRLVAGDGLGFCQCLDRWEREGAGKKTGEQTSSSPASACAGKEEQCRSKRHCFSFCFLKRK